MDPMLRAGFKQKQVGAPFIRGQVQRFVNDANKEQRRINAEEREHYLKEQLERQIDDTLISAKGSVRSLLSAIGKIIDLMEKHPGLEAHPKPGGFSERLNTLVRAITELSRRSNKRAAGHLSRRPH
jgi:hypothetical protein